MGERTVITALNPLNPEEGNIELTEREALEHTVMFLGMAIKKIEELDSFSRGSLLIAKERKCQIEKRGWTEEHDDQHNGGEMAKAAMAYIMESRAFFPWDECYWKPKDRVSNLVRAGALIAAEIDRELRRMERKVEL